MEIKRTLACSGIIFVMFLPLWVGAYFYGKLTGYVADRLTTRWFG